MGTVHRDKGELHGITVVVDTKGPKVFIGRCWEADHERIVLDDADEFEDGQDGRTKEEYVRRAAKVGVWKKHDRIVVPRSVVVSVTRLGEIPLA